MQLLILDSAAVKLALPMRDCIDEVRSVMRTVSRGGTQMPLRTIVPVPGTDLQFGAMQGCLGDPVSFGAKLLSARPHCAGIPSHVGVFVLFDAHSGGPTAIMDASELTAIRTAAATVVATQTLARPGAADLAILGTGEQAKRHLEALALTRPIRTVRVWGRNDDRSSEFAALQGEALHIPVSAVRSPREAVSAADLVCTVTASREPILSGAWLAEGAHVNLIGSSAASAREADDDVVARSRFFVDYRPSALAQAGELRHAVETGAVTERHIAGELGEVLNGAIPGRTAAGDITVYKSLGIAAQDLAAANCAYRRAIQMGIGRSVAF